MTFHDGLGDRGTVPEGEEIGGDRHGPDRMIAALFDEGCRQAARDGSGVQEGLPLIRPEFQVFQSGQAGDLQRVVERAGESGVMRISPRDRRAINPGNDRSLTGHSRTPRPARTSGGVKARIVQVPKLILGLRSG